MKPIKRSAPYRTFQGMTISRLIEPPYDPELASWSFHCENCMVERVCDDEQAAMDMLTSHACTAMIARRA